MSVGDQDLDMAQVLESFNRAVAAVDAKFDQLEAIQKKHEDTVKLVRAAVAQYKKGVVEDAIESVKVTISAINKQSPNFQIQLDPDNRDTYLYHRSFLISLKLRGQQSYQTLMDVSEISLGFVGQSPNFGLTFFWKESAAEASKKNHLELIPMRDQPTKTSGSTSVRVGSTYIKDRDFSEFSQGELAEAIYVLKRAKLELPNDYKKNLQEQLAAYLGEVCNTVYRQSLLRQGHLVLANG